MIMMLKLIRTNSGNFVTLLLLLLTLQGCSNKAPTLPKLPPDSTILSFGDSLTFGTGAQPDSSYPAVLQELSGLRVVNAGKPGEVTADGLERLPELLDEHRPQLLILCHGGNDMLRKKSDADTVLNLRHMVREATGRGIPVVLLGVPKPKLLLLKSADFYKNLATEMGLAIETEIIPKVLGDSSLKSDPIHPNARGYRQIAVAVHKLLVSTQAL